MKKAASILALACMAVACSRPAPAPAESTPAAVAPATAPAPVEDKAKAANDLRQMCDQYASLAKEIMQARQNGMPMREAMTIAKTDSGIEALVVAAYEQPGYSTEEHQKRTVTEFENEMYLTCAKAQGIGSN